MAQALRRSEHVVAPGRALFRRPIPPRRRSDRDQFPGSASGAVGAGRADRYVALRGTSAQQQTANQTGFHALIRRWVTRTTTTRASTRRLTALGDWPSTGARRESTIANAGRQGYHPQPLQAHLQRHPAAAVAEFLHGRHAGGNRPVPRRLSAGAWLGERA